MSQSFAPLPVDETRIAETEGDVCAALAQAYESRTAVYPIGGATSLDFGLQPSRSGLGLVLSSLARVIDYPDRDMTITVEAGIGMARLSAILAGAGQRLPLDIPDAERATLGGVIATNTNGPRRYGQGTIRDYVIGIRAVDGRGVAFAGGGRVVKNVAGYDFCKLLCGSLGTLGVVTQVTLKLKPLASASALVVIDLADWDRAEQLLAALVHSQTTPVAVELLCGPSWQRDEALGAAPANCVGRLVVGFEGSDLEVDWMVDALQKEWSALGAAGGRCVASAASSELWQRLTQFAADRQSPLTLKLTTLPSRVVTLARLLGEIDPQVSLQAHAGNGVVIVRLGQFQSSQILPSLIGRIQPACIASGGSATVLSASGLGELTAQAVWGPATAGAQSMIALRQQFDPGGILNPGRFVYG